MKASEIKVGGEYVARVSGKLTTVRVTAVREVTRYVGGYLGGSSTRESKVYDVLNVRTGRSTTFRSAAKFRRPAAAAPKFGYTEFDPNDLTAAK